MWEKVDLQQIGFFTEASRANLQKIVQFVIKNFVLALKYYAFASNNVQVSECICSLHFALHLGPKFSRINCSAKVYHQIAIQIHMND